MFFLEIPVFNANSVDQDQTPRLIYFYTVCQCPFYGTLDIIELSWCYSGACATLQLHYCCSLVQLDACLTDDQEVAGSTPAGSATLFRRD